ncbi:MAG: hypothetical protein Q4F57_00965 [Weeksellaceae bacterium]|nr:hypothetical protein [Weeksellaceae bacterium]
MRNFTLLSVLLVMWSSLVFAQQRSTVQATSQEISDNLDLRAVASVFAESRNLEQFEQKLNDPELMISNLDLNNDGYVDYLRVVEMKENRNHLVVIQAILGQDVYQDVATIDVQRQASNRATQVHIIGDPFLYGNNYIYQPVFAYTPLIYDYFWMPSHMVYVSPWRWNRFPRFYTPWRMYPMFRYRNHIHMWASMHNFYYMNTPWNHGFYNAYYYGPRMNHWEVRHPRQSFNIRNAPYNANNRHELAQTTGVGVLNNTMEHSNNVPIRRNSNAVTAGDMNIGGQATANNTPTRSIATNDGAIRSSNTPVRSAGPRDEGMNEGNVVVPKTNAVRSSSSLQTGTRATMQSEPTRATATQDPVGATRAISTQTPTRSSAVQNTPTRSSATTAPVRTPSRSSAVQNTPTRSSATTAPVRTPSRSSAVQSAPTRSSATSAPVRTPSRSSAVQNAPTRSSATSAPARTPSRSSGVQSAPSRSSMNSAPARSSSRSSGAIRR